MDICLRVLKESSKIRFDSYSVRNSIYQYSIRNSVLNISLLPFGIVACTFFRTTFLEIAVGGPADFNTTRG